MTERKLLNDLASNDTPVAMDEPLDIRIQIRIPHELYMKVVKAADERVVGVDLFVKLALLDALDGKSGGDS